MTDQGDEPTREEAFYAAATAFLKQHGFLIAVAAPVVFVSLLPVGTAAPLIILLAYLGEAIVYGAIRRAGRGDPPGRGVRSAPGPGLQALYGLLATILIIGGMFGIASPGELTADPGDPRPRARDRDRRLGVAQGLAGVWRAHLGVRWSPRRNDAHGWSLRDRPDRGEADPGRRRRRRCVADLDPDEPVWWILSISEHLTGLGPSATLRRLWRPARPSTRPGRPAARRTRTDRDPGRGR
jgi:hypothetical protein